MCVRFADFSGFVDCVVFPLVPFLTAQIVATYDGHCSLIDTQYQASSVFPLLMLATCCFISRARFHYACSMDQSLTSKKKTVLWRSKFNVWIHGESTDISAFPITLVFLSAIAMLCKVVKPMKHTPCYVLVVLPDALNPMMKERKKTISHPLPFLCCLCSLSCLVQI